MKKKFTQFFGVFTLICVLCLYSAFNVAAQTKSPLHGAVNVEPTQTQFELTFTSDVRVSAAGGTFSIYKGGALIKTIPVSTTSTDAYVTGRKFIVVHGLGNLTEGIEYALALTSGALEVKPATTWDVFAGIASTAWNFTIGDYTNPVLASTGTLTPVNNSTGIDARHAAFELVLKFNENVAKGESGNIYIYKNNGTIVEIIPIIATSVIVSTVNVTVPVSNVAIFEELTDYYVIVEAGAITDASGNKNPFAGISSPSAWKFTTRDYSAPVFTAKSVGSPTISGATLSVTTNEPAKVYYKVQAAGDAAPIDLTGFSNFNVATGGTATTQALAGSAGTAYKVYLAADNKMTSTPDVTVAPYSFVEFSTVDNVNPAPTANVIVNNTAKQTVGLKITFTELVAASGTGVVEIKKQTNNEIVRSVATSEITVTNNATATVTATEWYVNIPFAALDSEGLYYVILPAGLIKDTATNPFAGYTTTSAWAFMASDYEKPVATLSASTFASGKVDALAANIYINFNEAVSLVTGAWSDAVALELNNVAVASAVSYDGTNNRIVIDPTANLTSNTTYTLKLRGNSVKDANGNIADAKTFNVITNDLDAKLITINVPVTDGLANETVNPTITFSKNARIASNNAAITTASLTAAISFTKTNTTTGNVAFTVTYNATTFVATVIPNAALVSSGAYSLSIDGALFESVYDGSVFTSPTAATFAVRDYVKPAVALSHEGDKIVAVTDNITITITDVNTLSLLNGNAISDINVGALITFKKDGVSGANLAFVATYVGGVITINPTVDFVFDNTYYYGIGTSIKDAQGNVINAKYGTFTAKQDPGAVKAIVSTYSPAINEVSVTTNTSNNLVATLTFDKQLRAGSAIGANAELWLTGGGAAAATVAITSANINGNIVALTFPTVTLNSSAEYYIVVPADVVEGNSTVTVGTSTYYPQFDGIVANVWKFKAKDTVAPPGTGVPTGADIALNADIEVTSNEPIVLGTGNILIKEGGTTVQTIAVNSTNVIIATDRLSAKIIHADLVKYSTAYEVTVPATALKDTAANSMAAVVWSFTTLANPVPTVTTLVPADESDLVSLTTPFSITFSEPMAKGAAGHTIFLLKKNGITPATLGTGGTINLGTDVLVKSVLVEDAAVAISGTIAQITFGVTLDADKEYYVLVESGTFKDVSLPDAADFAGLTTYGEWNFNTGDVNVPTYIVSYTERGTDKMTYNSDITLTFNKPIETTGNVAINSTDIATLFAVTVNGASVSFTGTIDATKTIVVITNSSINPAINAVTNSGHNVVVTGSGLFGVVSNAGATVSSSITIGDYIVPALTTTVPTNTAGITAIATFSSTKAGTVYYQYQTGTSSTATPAAAVVMGGTPVTVAASTAVNKTISGLTSETSYVIFSVAVDAVGNTSAVNSTVFVTPDITKPVLAAALPTTFTAAGKLKIKFSEDVNPGAVVKLYNKETGAFYAQSTLVVVSGTAASNDTLITGVFTLPLTAVEFYAEIEGGVIADGASLTFDGVYRPTWVVTTADATAPTLVANTNFGVRQAVNANFTFTFSENVKLVSTVPAEAFLIEYKNGSVWEPYEVINPANMTIVGAVVTINPSRDFAASKSEILLENYRLTVKKDAIADMANNLYGTAGTFVGDEFNIVDAIPAAAVFGPTDIIASTTSLTIVFDEELYMLDGTVLDNWDVDSLVTFTHAGTAFSFDASVVIVANTTTTITITGFDALADYKGDSFTYGFKAAFKDLTGNVVVAGSRTFVVPLDPITSPYVVFSPDNGISADATSVLIAQVFTITFNGQLYTWNANALANNLAVTAAYLEGAVASDELTSTGAIGLKNETNGKYVSFTANITTWNATTTVVTITPSEALTSESGYTLAVVGGMVQLGTSNSAALSSSRNLYVANDVIAPILDVTVDTNPWENGVYPVSGTVIAKTDSIKLAFVEKVKAGTGSIKIYRWDGVLAKTIEPSALTFSEDSLIVTITGLSDLTTNTEYYAIIPSGAIVDLAGNAYAGISVINQWSFTVQDDNVPQKVEVSPLGGNIMVTTDLTIKFDRNVILGSATGYVAVYKADGTAVQLIRVADGTAPFTINGAMVTVNISNLMPETQYKVEVAAGTFKTASGVDCEMIAASDWMFTTEDNTAPIVIDYMPAKGDSIDLWNNTLSLKFDKNIAKGTGKIYVRKANGDLVQEFDVNSANVNVVDDMLSFAVTGLVKATSYYVIVENTAITNTSATPERFAGLLTTVAWSFSTKADDAAPTAVYAPTTTELVAAQVILTMTFNEPVLLGSGNVVIYNAANDSVVETIAVVQSMINDTVVTVAPTKIVEGTSYYVMVSAGAVKDYSDNNFAGVITKTEWTFATGDNTAPLLISWTPDGDTIADNHPTFVMTFDEDVVLGDMGYLYVTEKDSAAASLTIEITADMIENSIVTVPYVYDPLVGGLKTGTEYVVTVDAGVVTDAAGNATGAVTAETGWTFTTGPDWATAIEPAFNTADFKVYPNPFNDRVFIDNNEKLTRVVFSNIAGQRVMDIEYPEREIRTNNLVRGMYIVSMFTENGIAKTTKIIKK